MSYMKIRVFVVPKISHRTLNDHLKIKAFENNNQNKVSNLHCDIITNILGSTHSIIAKKRELKIC